MNKNNLAIENILIVIFLMFFLMTMIVSLHKTFDWFMEKKKIESQLNEINKVVEIIEIEDSDNTFIIESASDEETTDIEESDIEDAKPTVPSGPNHYVDYIKMNLIDVDFSELKKINPSTKGWIQVNGTNINYPFVQSGDNDYYLTHAFDKSYNSAGWVFLDYRNDISSTEKNTIIYAHSRLDKTMFGSLKNILTNGWLQNTKNYVIKLSTEKENTLWQVFSIYHIPTTNDYIRVNFLNDNDFLEFSTTLLNRSLFDFGTSVNGEDRILTLSTCYNKQEKSKEKDGD